MKYRLNLFRDERLVDTEALGETRLANATAKAITAVDDRACDRAEVCNAKGAIVFRHPPGRVGR